jgi:mitogen-activated protein kinase organizer 1
VIVPKQCVRPWTRDSLCTSGCCSAEIVGGSVDGTVRRFDVRMGLEVSDSLGAAVTSVSVSGDGLCILASCMDGTVKLLDKSGGDLLASYSGMAFQVISA